MRSRFVISICFAALVCSNATARQKTSSLKDGRSYVSVLESTVQRVLPGRKESPVTSTYHFIIIWKNRTAPESFFWRGQNGWLTCTVQKVHKQVGGYIPDVAGLTASIHKGDTLALTPVTGGRFVVPQQIPDNATNTLFFKTVNSAWRYYVFRKLTAKQDIILP